MHQVRKLISQIRAAVSDAPPAFPLEPLAAEYARWREEAARRLETCAALLARGSEHSALEIAEAQPPVLDLVAELSFAEEPQWQSLCARNELPVGPALDPKTISALDEVYAKGLSPNSPLYQEYRAAVTARDEAKALHIIRTIARVNPSDASAQAELDRLRNKFMMAKLQAMRAALSANDDSAVSNLVEELEELAPPEKLQSQADFARALAIHKRVQLAKAGRDLPAMLAELEGLQRSGDWQLAAQQLAILEDQERDLGLTMDSAQSSRRDAVRRFVNNSRVDVEVQRRFLQAVERLRLTGEQTATRAAGASTLTLAEAEELEAKFDQVDHEVKQFGRTIPAEAAQSIDASRRTVHGAASRIRNRIAMRRFAVVAVAILALSVVLGWVGRSVLVKSYREKLALFQKQGQALAAQELLQHINKHNILWIHSAPDLQAAVAQTGHWVSAQAELSGQAQAQIAALEQQDPSKAGTVEMYEGLTAVRDLSATLAPDMALPLKERIALVQRTLDAHFVKLRQAGGETWQNTYSQAQALLDPVTLDKPFADVTAALAKATPLLRTLESDVNHPVPALRPAGDKVQEFELLATKAQDLRAEVTALNAARSAMEHADTLEAYAAALASYAEVRFPEASLARPVLKEFPTADDIPTRLLMEGDREGWKAVKMDKAFGVAMHPQDVRQDEVNLLLMVRDDPDLKDVWQWTLVGEGGTHLAFSHGQLREYSVGSDTRYSGKLWDPQEKSMAPVFADVKLTKSGGPKNVSSFTLSPTSRLLEGLKLQTLTDASGTQWTRSAFEVMHGIVHSVAGSATARAILMQHIGALISLRPYDWGRHYCPSLRRDLMELDTLCGNRRLNTFEWMLPASAAKLEGNLSAFFDKIHKREYLNEARRFRDVALTVRDAGAVFAGFVDHDGTARVTQRARAGGELWCIDAGGPVLLRMEPGASNAGLGTQTKACRPFSVLVQIPVDRPALLQKFGVSDPVIPFLHAP